MKSQSSYFITVWFSTLSDALAEQQAKSTAGSLRKLETEVPSKKIITEGWTRTIVNVKSTELRKDDLILIEKGDVVPLDADVLEGIAMVDESLVTGESAPVRKAPGDSLIGGSRVVSDTLTAKVTTNPGETFIDQMIKMVESSKRPKTPNEVAITIVLIGLTAIFTIIILALLGMSVTLGLRCRPIRADCALCLPSSHDNRRTCYPPSVSQACPDFTKAKLSQNQAKPLKPQETPM